MPRVSSMRELPMVDQISSEQQPTATKVVDAFVTMMDKARHKQTTIRPSDEDLARAVTAAIKLYAARAEQTVQNNWYNNILLWINIQSEFLLNLISYNIGNNACL